MGWLALAFVSMALYGLANLADKFSVTDRIRGAGSATALNSGVLYAFLVAGALLATAQPPAGGVSSVLLPLPLVAIGLATGALFTLGTYVYFVALQREEASRFIGMFSVIPLFTAALAFLFLGERVPAPALGGVVLVVIGAVLLSVRRFGRKLHLSSALLLAIAGALPFAAVDVLLKSAVPSAGAAPLLFWSGIGGLVSIVPGFMARPPLHRAGLSALVASGIMSAAAYFLFTQALVTGPVSLAAGIIQIKPLLVLAAATGISRFAPRAFAEDIRRIALAQKLAAIALVVLGALLLI